MHDRKAKLGVPTGGEPGCLPTALCIGEAARAMRAGSGDALRPGAAALGRTLRAGDVRSKRRPCVETVRPSAMGE